jgi:hypothetical protein
MFILLSFCFLFSYFLLSIFSFLLSFFFSFLFIFFMLLQTFKLHSTCYSSPLPCLNDCSSSGIEVRGPMVAREVQNPFVPL